MIRCDSPPRDRETNSQSVIREGRNVDCAWRRKQADAIANAGASTAIGGGDADQQRGRRVAHKLNEKFVQVDRHVVQPMPSANLAMAMNELSRLQQTPELAKASAMLKAAAVQVLEIRENQAPSQSTGLNRSRRSRCPRSHRSGGSHFQAGGPYLQGGSRGNYVV
jgi:hypothetical protein